MEHNSKKLKSSSRATNMDSKDFMARALQPTLIGDEFVRCCLFSTVRGVPRILRSRDSLWRSIWLISVLGLFCGALFCAYFLTMQYFDYRDMEIQSRSFESAVPFPSVTVCNLKCFDNRKKLSEAHHSQFIEQLKTRVDFAYNNLLSDVSKRDLFFSSLHLNISRSIGFEQDEFVVNGTCSYHQLHSLRHDYSTCSVALITQHPQFFNCFTFEAMNNITNTTLSLQMILNLNTVESLDCSKDNCDNKANLLRNDFSGSSFGARVFIHPPGSHPEFGDDGIDILPGTKSTIEIFPTKETYLKTPRSQCSNALRKIQLFDPMNESSIRHFEHSSSLCLNLKIQKFLAQTCDCIDSRKPIEIHHANLPFCFSLTESINSSANKFNKIEVNTSNDENDWVNIFNRRAECARNVMNEMQNTHEICLKSCWKLWYNKQISLAKWPAKHKEFEFYQNFIQLNSKQSLNYQEFNHIEQLLETNRRNEARQKVEASQIISRNFIYLKIFRSDFSFKSITRSLFMSSTQLISQIGGMFSLWCGLGIITVVEIMELISYVIRHSFANTMVF